MSPPLPPESLQRAIDLQAEGKTQAQIALRLGVCLDTISRNLGRRNRQANALIEERIAEERVRQVECLQWLQAYCLDCFRASQMDVSTTEYVDETVGDRTVRRERLTIQERDGSPAFLMAAMAAMAAIRRIYGLEKSSKPSDVAPLVQGIVAGFLRYVPPELHAGILERLNRDFRGAFGTISAAPEGVPLPPLPGDRDDSAATV